MPTLVQAFVPGRKRISLVSFAMEELASSWNAIMPVNHVSEQVKLASNNNIPWKSFSKKYYVLQRVMQISITWYSGRGSKTEEKCDSVYNRAMGIAGDSNLPD
jgi:hypothetical protein